MLLIDHRKYSTISGLSITERKEISCSKETHNRGYLTLKGKTHSVSRNEKIVVVTMMGSSGDKLFD